MPDLALTPVRDLKTMANAGSGTPFASVLILRKVTTRTASNGNPFLSAEFGDRTGSFSCTVFGDSPAFEPIKALAEGAVVRVEGKTDSFQGRLAPRLSKAVAINPEELTDSDLLASLVETAPEDAELLWKDFLGFVAGIRHLGLREPVKIAVEEIGDTLRWAPAAISMHHAYRHGLLEHTVHMARAANALFPFYKEVDPDLAMAGILLHDTGKTIEYEGAMSAKRSRRGILQGHVVLGYQLTRAAGLKAGLDPDRLERLEHIILSHQGELEWGAAAMAATPEAVFVSMIDNLDAKMGMVQRALRQAAPTDEFSERLAGLNTSLLVRAVPQLRPAQGQQELGV